MTRPSWDETWLRIAAVMAERSRCASGAGCVIVDPEQRIVATGYPGPPKNYETTWQGDDGWSPYRDLDDCRSYCLRSRRPSAERDLSYEDCPTVHAEINALITSDRSRIEGGTMYVSSSVCRRCVPAVGNSGVVRVVWPQGPADEYRKADIVVAYLERCGITVNVIP